MHGRGQAANICNGDSTGTPQPINYWTESSEADLDEPPKKRQKTDTESERSSTPSMLNVDIEAIAGPSGLQSDMSTDNPSPQSEIGETGSGSLQENQEQSNTCSICNESFSKGKQLIEHEQIHTEHLQFSCSYCPRLFKHKRSRDRHTKLHTGDKKYKCQQCESAFSRSDHLKIHMKTHDSRKPYKCGTCNRGYNTAAALSSHQQNHLKQENRSGSRASGESTPSPGVFRCSQCTEIFNKPELLQNHVLLVHSDTDSTSRTPEHPLSDSIPPSEDGLKIVCMYCAKDFPSIDLMYQHVGVAHSDFQNGISSSPNKLSSPKAEIMQNGTPTYACDRCTMQFECFDSLRDHNNKVHWRPQFKPVKDMGSDLMGQDYNSFSSLQTQPTDLSRKQKKDDSEESNEKKKRKNQHVSPVSPYDTIDKPCICSCCYAQLPNFKSFLSHMETHMISNNGPILGFCPVCGEPGRDPASFTNHIFGHAIVQVPGHCCYHCKKTFEHFDKLQKHLVEVHVMSIFKCSLCNELFDTKISMQMHLSSKHSDECKHYKCHLCSNQVFHDRLSAELHISMKHYHQFAPCMATNPPLLRSQYQMDLDSRLRDYGMIFQCTFCQKSFKDQYSQYIHILKEHNDAKDNEKFMLDNHSQSQGQNPSVSPNFNYSRRLSTPEIKLEPKTRENFTCDICNHSDISSEVELIAHKKVHNKGKIGAVSLQCAYCNEFCKSRNDLESHMKSHQVSCGKGKHKCNICDEIFASSLTLADHKLTHCKIVEGNNCVQCKTVLTDEQSFYSHQLQHNTNPVKPNSQLSLPANCIICCQTLQTDVEIKLHAKFHLKHLFQKEFLCGVCNKIFDGQSGLSYNGSPKLENLNIAVCKDCGIKGEEGDSDKSKYFGSIHPPSLDMEQDRKQIDSSSLECRLCKQLFPSALKLQTHLIEHNFYGMNQYSCYVCSSVFTAASGLQNHIITHGLDHRPYECSYCQMKFFFRAELDNHRYVHLKQAENNVNGRDFEEPYMTCKYCPNNVFLDNAIYLQHISQCPYRLKENSNSETNTPQMSPKIKSEVVTKTEIDVEEEQ